MREHNERTREKRGTTREDTTVAQGPGRQGGDGAAATEQQEQPAPAARQPGLRAQPPKPAPCRTRLVPPALWPQRGEAGASPQGLRRLLNARRP